MLWSVCLFKRLASQPLVADGVGRIFIHQVANAVHAVADLDWRAARWAFRLETLLATYGLEMNAQGFVDVTGNARPE